MARKISKDPSILGGEPVFHGTRVPSKILIEHLEGGGTIPSATAFVYIAREEHKLFRVTQPLP